MRIKKHPSKIVEGDLTPMIDMAFQLIAFFMVLINFSQNDQNAEIELPKSALAKPPEQAAEYPITLQLTESGKVIVGGQEVPMGGVRFHLIKERNILELKGKGPADATVIIRAHRLGPVGVVQELMKLCQDNQFERFALRAKEEVGY